MSGGFCWQIKIARASKFKTRVGKSFFEAVGIGNPAPLGRTGGQRKGTQPVVLNCGYLG